MNKLYCMGEALIDFTPRGEGVFCRNAGGAPANVAVCAARLGAPAAMITKLGRDMFGDYLENILSQNGVETDYVYRTSKANTALAFITLGEKGERSFTFYRNPSADMMLEEAEVESIPFVRGDILHFGSVDLVDYPVRKAHLAAIRRAKAAGATVSFDPNLRYNLWHSSEELISVVNAFWPLSDIVKVSEEELKAISGKNDEAAAVKFMFRGDVKLLFVTRGARGSSVYTVQDNEYSVPAEKCNCADTTGAGDGFTGAVLYKTLESGVVRGKLAEMGEELKKFLIAGNKVGAYVCERCGAIPAMPTHKEIFG